MKTIANTISEYNKLFGDEENKICEFLFLEIENFFKKSTFPKNLKGVEKIVEGKIWHGGPVWFIGGNPIVSYTKQKMGIKLMFFSGASFDSKKTNSKLELGSGKFKDAGIFYNDVKEINKKDVQTWLKKSVIIQWDYKNIMKRKGRLIRLKYITK